MKTGSRATGSRAALLALIGLAALAFSVAPGCGGNDNPTPPTTSSASSSSASSGVGGASSTSSGGGGAGGGAGGSGGGANCSGPNGCYSCAPKTDGQILNACTDAQCSPFDNKARLPLYNNGNLPQIP